MPGVRHVVKVNDATVAVVADTWWQAKKALDALPIVWDEGDNAKESSATIAERLKEGLTAPGDYAANKNGDATAALGGAAKRIEAVYATPFLAHACMEPMNCVAKVYGRRAEVWVPTQNGEASLAALSEASGLPLDKCEVYKHDLGGGFGRRGGTQDYVRQAVSIAKQIPGVPIKMIWSREEDMAHDFYRPISQCRMEAGLDAAGNLTALAMRISGQSINAFSNPAAIKDGKDMRQLQGLTAAAERRLHRLHRAEPRHRVRHAQQPRCRSGPWRGVNTNQNAVYLECFIDEAAQGGRQGSARVPPRADGQAPAASRRARTRPPRRPDWGKPLPAGVHRGIAQFKGYGSYSAAVAEVSVSERGKLKVHRLVFALDSGHVVNPSPGRGPGRGLGRLRPRRHALRREHGQGRPHRRAEFRHLRAAAPGRDAEGRDRAGALGRLLGRRRRADHLRRGAGRHERHPSRRPASRCARCR